MPLSTSGFRVFASGYLLESSWIMKPRILVMAFLGIVLSMAGQVWAHPGHGATEPSSLAHYTVESMHSLPLWLALAAAATGILAWQLRRRLV